MVGMGDIKPDFPQLSAKPAGFRPPQAAHLLVQKLFHCGSSNNSFVRQHEFPALTIGAPCCVQEHCEATWEGFHQCSSGAGVESIRRVKLPAGLDTHALCH